MKCANILLVDDDPLTLALLEGILCTEKTGISVIKAESSRAAYEMCSKQHIDCVLIDYDMPDMDGLSLAKKVRDIRPHLAIILCTGAGDEMLVARALKSGVTDYLTKNNLSEDTLFRTIATAVELCSRQRQIEEQRTELETFAIALAHDFKQPVRQIMTFSQMAASELKTGATSRLPTFMRFLDDAAGRLDQLVEIMLQYTVLQEEPESDAISVSAVAGGVLASIGNYIDERCGFVSLGEDAGVWANAPMLARVLQNLVINGLKYNESIRPSVRIEAKVGRDGYVTISVQDNGIGIPPEYMDYIFQPLARLHTRKQYEGSGIGLALARKAVLAMQGTIACVSTPGAGSTFDVRLPAARLELAAA